MEYTVAEQRNKRKSRNYSIAIHVLLLLLLFVFGRFEDDPDESINEQYAVAIDFTLDKSSNSTSGKEAAGATPEQAEKAERAKEQEQEEVPPIREVIEELQEEEVVDEPIQEAPTPITPEVEEVLEDDSPIVAVESPVVFEKPTKQEVPVPQKVEVPIQKPKVEAPSKPTVPATKPSTSKPANTGNGAGTVNTTTKPSGTKPGTGDTNGGSGSGKDNSGNDGNSGVGTGGTGLGEYDDSGNGIFGRKIIKIPSLYSIMNKGAVGKISIKMCVNPRGEVIHTELNRKETSITDKALLREALKVAKNYIYEKDVSAPAEQCGKFTFILDINKLY